MAAGADAASATSKTNKTNKTNKVTTGERGVAYTSNIVRAAERMTSSAQLFELISGRTSTTG